MIRPVVGEPLNVDARYSTGGGDGVSGRVLGVMGLDVAAMPHDGPLSSTLSHKPQTPAVSVPAATVG